MSDSIPAIPADKPRGMSFEKALPWLKAGSFIRNPDMSYGAAWGVHNGEIRWFYRENPTTPGGEIFGTLIGQYVMRDDWEKAKNMEDFKWDTP